MDCLEVNVSLLMANEERNYTADFKIKVAKAALEQDKKNLDRLSDKFDVPVSDILTWAVKLEKHSEQVFRDESEMPESVQSESDETDLVDLEVTDRDIENSIHDGVMKESLNYRRLIFWSVFGTILATIFVFTLKELYEYSSQLNQDQVSSQSEFYEVNKLKREATEQLNSFGVVDSEQGIYRIPIDSAITDVVENQ